MIKTTISPLVLLPSRFRQPSGISTAPTRGLPPLRTVAVERGDLQFTIDATGTVQAEEVVDVGAQVAGKIQSLGVDPRDAKRTIDYGSPVKCRHGARSY